MKPPLIALIILLLWPACATTGAPPRPGYMLEATNNHPFDVVAYIVRGGARQRLGRMGPMEERTFRLSQGEIQSNPRVLVCVGSWTPTNTQCYLTLPIQGHYPGQDGGHGVVFLVIQRGMGGIVAILNG